MSRLIPALLALLMALPAAAQPVPVTPAAPAATAASTAGMSRNTAELQRQLAAERAKVNDLKLKLRIKASINPFRTPLQNFFDSPEFWENVIDVAGQECANRCIRAATAHRQACARIVDSAKKDRCYQEAANNAASCQRSCFR